MRFDGKVVIVTGGSSGIGLACSQRFAQEGAHVVIAGHSLEDAQKALAGLQGPAEHLAVGCDVSDEAAVERCCDEAVQRFGRLDVVVNNAGVMTFDPIEDTTSDTFLQVLKVDLVGAFYFTKHGFRRMKPGSAIVNVASIHAVQTEKDAAPYAAAKAAQLSLTRTACIEGREKGIRVNAVLPGAIDTPMLWDNPNVKSGVEKIDPKDVGKPAEIAAAVAFLASDDASFVTGASLPVDGGRLARL